MPRPRSLPRRWRRRPERRGLGSQAAAVAKVPLWGGTVEGAEAGVHKMLEFYFGDFKFGWDRFM